MIRKSIFLLLPLLFAAGCIGQRMIDCPPDEPDGRYLRFSYTYNDESADRLDARVNDIRVWVFDGSGLLVDIFDLEAEDIARGYVNIDDLPDGRYTFVALAGSGTDIMESFSGVDMIDAATNSHKDIAIGQTALSDFYMLLDCVPDPVDAGTDVAPANGAFDDLFYARAADVDISADRDQNIAIDFLCNTNVLKITVSGLPQLADGTTRTTRAPLSDPPVRIYVVGKNGRYRSDNTIDAAAHPVRYESTEYTLEGKKLGVDIKTLRFDVARHAADPVLLHIEDVETGEPVVEPIDVIEELLGDDYPSGNDPEAIRSSQELLDRRYEHTFDITLTGDTGNLYVTVSTGGWGEGGDVEPDLTR